MEIERCFGLEEVEIQSLRLGQLQLGFNGTERAQAGFEVSIRELGIGHLTPERVGL